MKEKIILKDVIQRFGNKEVLKGVSFTIQSGEIFGLLGPSGAGKTTIIKIITGQLKPTSGRAVTDGEDAEKLSGIMYKKMGMMLDNYGLYVRLSCYDNLTKGMRGRLVLARAVMNEPEILFLDEPTSGLDPSTTNRIHELILEEQAKGTTIFLTTHNMAEAEKLCRHVALLHEGNIVEYGEPKEICRKYNHQNKLQIRLYDGTCMEIGNNREAAETVKEYLEAGNIETIHSTEPNLETVFMELTGKSLV